MPITAAPIKVESVKRLGGIIELVGETYAEAQTYAQVCLSCIVQRKEKKSLRVSAIATGAS